jgi:hypothetical protein
MPISALNFCWLTDPHALQDTPTLDSETKRDPLERISFLEWVYDRERPASSERHANTDSNQKASHTSTI